VSDDEAIARWHRWLDEKEREYRIAGVDAPNLDALWEAAYELSLGDPDPPDEWIKIPRWMFAGLVYSLSLSLQAQAPKKRTHTKGRPRKDRVKSPLEAAREYAIHFPRWAAVDRLRRNNKMKLEVAVASVAEDMNMAEETIRDSHRKIEALRKLRFR
jgi:hypothetical protein